MKSIVLVAGGTGDLGGRIVNSLLQKGAEVRVPVRDTTPAEKLARLEQNGVHVVKVDMNNVSALAAACEGVSCVVSALQGLRDVIVDAQSVLLEAAVEGKVPHFIPSDYSTDFTRLTVGDNRNFDLRREFHERLYKADIKPTSIYNGAFAELLSRNIPFLNFKNQTVGYLEDPDWYVDFSTMDNTAAFTAAAALDPAAPRSLRIASFQVSANQMLAVAEEIFQQQFKLVRLASRDEMAAKNKADRAAHPEGENEVYARWQQAQYIHSMFSAHHDALDNDRYPGITWTGLRELLLAQKHVSIAQSH